MIYVKIVFCVIVLAAVVFRFVFQVKKEDRINESYGLFLATAIALVMLPHHFVKPGILLQTLDYTGLLLALAGIVICLRTRRLKKIQEKQQKADKKKGNK